MYDAIVVGARCAGAGLALELAKQGRRVLLLERSRSLGNTLSTHFVWPRGMSYLASWGVLDRVTADTPTARTLEVGMEGIRLTGAIPRSAIEARHRQLHGAEADVSHITERYMSVRRQHLDPLLLEAAGAAGAEVAMGCKVNGLLREGERVVGVTYVAADGTTAEARAPLTVGADGRRSTVARLLDLQPMDVRQKCSFAMWSYFGGLELDHGILLRKGRLGYATVPTNDGLTMSLVYGPAEWYAAFTRDRESAYHRAIDTVAPDLAQRLADEGERAEGWYATHEMAAFHRRDHGPGWALVGDAATVKDQCTAIGMTHAFRDAALLADALKRADVHGQPLDTALDDYSGRRYRDHSDYYDFVSVQAEMKPLDDMVLELVDAASRTPEGTGRFLAAFSDTSPVRAFFSRGSRARLLRALDGSEDRVPGLDAATTDRYYANPFATRTGPEHESVAMTRTVLDFARPTGRRLLERGDDYHRWRQERIDTATWNFTRTLHGPPTARADIASSDGRRVRGINLGSQDYLSLSSHPAVHEAGIRAIRDFGVHSAGSPLLVGNTTLTAQLEDEIGELVGARHVALFPTGWAAGYGAVSALVRDQDYILMDRYAHACLQQGANASKGRIYRYQHLDTSTARHWLEHIRASDAHGGILVVTEGLFSMDSDVPDLRELQDLCRSYDATLLVDVAHDLGAMGPGGTGSMGTQGVLGDIDIVMGSFSKTFASNGGFVASNHAPFREYLRMFASPHAFSNALSPMQVAVVTEAFRIVKSAEGDALRAASQRAILALREGVRRRGGVPMGGPSPIVPVLLGDERLARIAYRMLLDRDMCGNMVEFPGVASGMARFRLQVMASHTPEEMDQAAEQVVQVTEAARTYLEKAHELDIAEPGNVRIAGGPLRRPAPHAPPAEAR